MTDFLEEHPKTAIAMIVAAALCMFGVHHVVKRFNARVIEMVDEIEGEGRDREPESERLKEVRLGQHKDPDTALKQVEAILAAPGDPTEAASARKRHAAVLQLCFNQRLKEENLAEARVFMDRLAQTYPESYVVESVRRGWSNKQKRVCRDHVKEGRFAEAKAILQELSDERLFYGDSNLLGAYQQALAESWVNETTAKMDKLSEASSVLAEIGPGSPLGRILRRSSLPGEKLLELANESAAAHGAGKYRAVPLYHAVLDCLNQGRNWFRDGREPTWEQKKQLHQQIEYRLATLYSELGKEMEAGRRPLITTIDVEKLYERAAFHFRTVALKPFLLRRQLRLQTARLREMSAPVMACSLDAAAGKLPAEQHKALRSAARESGGLADKILQRSAGRLWASVVVDPKFDPWPLLPADVRVEFEAERKKGRKEEYLRKLLASRGGMRKFPIPLPELVPVRRLAGAIEARRGLLIHVVQPAEGVLCLRRSLVSNPDPDLRNELIAAVSRAMMASRREENFEAFYELTRFFMGDIGLEDLPGGDREQFQVALGEAADSLAKRQRFKAAYLWAIQSEIYAGQPAGQAAQEKAMKVAYGVSLDPENAVKASALPRSGLNGYSVLSIDNSAEHHLLIFYRGPESFILACRPYRKTSAVIVDGDYDVVVITPSGAIDPYRGEAQLIGSWQRSNYRISTREQDRQFTGSFASSASGEYELVRAPNGMKVEVDPRTGAVR